MTASIVGGQAAFDYSALPKDTADYARAAATRIRAHETKATEAILEVGRECSNCVPLVIRIACGLVLDVPVADKPVSKDALDG